MLSLNRSREIGTGIGLFGFDYTLPERGRVRSSCEQILGFCEQHLDALRRKTDAKSESSFASTSMK